MSIRRIIGLVLIGASYWLLRGRFAAMSFEVSAGNSWAGVFTDIEYLIPGGGAFLALVGGTAAALGRSGRIPASIGTGLVLLYITLLAVMSGMFDMVQPFLASGIVMLLATVGLFTTKTD